MGESAVEKVIVSWAVQDGEKGILGVLGVGVGVKVDRACL